MPTTVRCTMPGQRRQRPDLLKAFAADFQRLFRGQQIDQPDQLGERSTVLITSRSVENCDVRRSQGNPRSEIASVALPVSRVAVPAGNAAKAPIQLERYLLNEADYIRAFGY